MKGLWKRIAALLTVCVLLISLVIAGSAAPRDGQASCSLIISVSNEELTETADNYVYDLYYVAAFSEGDTLSANTDRGFGALSDDDLNSADSKDDWNDLAQKAFQIALGCGEFEGEMPATAVQLGCRVYEQIFLDDQGLYLVIARHADQERPLVEERTNEEGETAYVTVVYDGLFECDFAPLLVTLPSTNTNPDSPDSWSYDVTRYLKAGVSKRSMKKIILHKTSEENDQLNLEGATFELYATRVADPSLISDENTIITYVEGNGYVTLYKIGEYTTDKSGDIVLDADILDNNTLYAWREIVAPDSYVVDPEPHFFFAYGEGIDLDDEYDMTVIFDSEHPNATGGVTMSRVAEGNMNIVTLRNEGDVPVYLNLRAYNDDEGELDGNSLGFFLARPEMDDWGAADGFYFRYEPLYPGEESQLRIKVEWDEETRAPDDLYSLAGRIAIAYDFFPAEEGGETDDLKVTGTARTVGSSRYNPLEYPTHDRENGLTITNKLDVPEPPPGVTLPESGGIGTTVFSVAGALIASVAVILLMLKKRRIA